MLDLIFVYDGDVCNRQNRQNEKVYRHKVKLYIETAKIHYRLLNAPAFLLLSIVT